MDKELWFVHRLGPIEIVIGAITVSGITTIGGIWVTTAAKSAYAHPFDNLPYTIVMFALFLLFNGLLLGLCCAAALCFLRFLAAAGVAFYRLLRVLLAQPLHLIHFIITLLIASIEKSRALRRRLLR